LPAYPYDWRGFVGTKKKTSVGLLILMPQCSETERRNTKRPMLSSFWLSRNLYNNMDGQASTGDTVLVKNRGMTGRSQTLP
jgi:hypothetical protein